MAMMRSMGFTAVVIVLVEVRRGRVTKERIDFLFVLSEGVDEQWSCKAVRLTSVGLRERFDMDDDDVGG